jgi:hypothetical protein
MKKNYQNHIKKITILKPIQKKKLLKLQNRDKRIRDKRHKIQLLLIKKAVEIAVKREAVSLWNLCMVTHSYWLYFTKIGHDHSKI